MKRRPDQRRPTPYSTNVHRLPEGSELVLSDSETVVLVVRGECTIRSGTRAPQRAEAGAVLLSAASPRNVFDKPIARAIALLRAQPANRWTVKRLAAEVGLSRAALARRFTSVTGRAPGRFLSDLRLALAAALLESTDQSLAELATSIGYTCEFSFSRAFKRQHGVAPGTFRRLRRSREHCLIGMAA